MAQELTMKTQGMKSVGHDGWVQAFFEQGSICTKNMTESTSPCKIVNTAARSGGGKQGAMIVESPDTRFADLSSTGRAEEAEA